MKLHAESSFVFFSGFTRVIKETNYANVFETRMNYYANIGKNFLLMKHNFLNRNRKRGERRQV